MAKIALRGEKLENPLNICAGWTIDLRVVVGHSGSPSANTSPVSSSPIYAGYNPTVDYENLYRIGDANVALRLKLHDNALRPPRLSRWASAASHP